jgi:hypothetical protein
LKITSLVRLAEEAAYAAQDRRNLSGSIENVGKFEENFAALDSSHDGIYAFLAFHPVADQQVLDYVIEGTLGDDAGPHILALFLSPAYVGQPREAKPIDAQLGVKLTGEQHPAYELARDFFPSNAKPRLPGLIFFDFLSQPKDSIYVILQGNDVSAIRWQCREVFESANKAQLTQCTGGDGTRWNLDFDRFAASLSGMSIQYQRAGHIGIRAAALIVGVWVKKNAKALVTAIPKIIQLGVKIKSAGSI